MAGYILRLTLFGLIGFVPNPEAKNVTVLLFDAKYEKEFKECKSHPHEPYLVSYLSMLDAGDKEGYCKTSGGELIPSSGPKFCRWKLEKVYVEFKGLAESGFSETLDMRERIGGFMWQHEAPLSKEEAWDSSWLAEVSKTGPGSDRILKEVMTNSFSNGVIAKMTLNAGNGRVCHLITGRDDKVIQIFRFMDIQANGYSISYKQALADEVQAEVPMKDKGLEVLLRPESGTAKSIKLVADANYLDLILANEPTEDCSEKCKAIGADFGRFCEWTKKCPKGKGFAYAPIVDRPEMRAEQPACDSTMVEKYGYALRYRCLVAHLLEVDALPMALNITNIGEGSHRMVFARLEDLELGRTTPLDMKDFVRDDPQGRLDEVAIRRALEGKRLVLSPNKIKTEEDLFALFSTDLLNDLLKAAGDLCMTGLITKPICPMARFDLPKD